MSLARQRLVRFALALLALALLSYASVQSLVMQAAAESAPMGLICGQSDMPGTSGAAHHTGNGAGAKHQGVCPYCAAAANPPIMMTAPPFRAPTTFAFLTFQTVQPLGPRGPPVAEPRARGPPAAITSA